MAAAADVDRVPELELELGFGIFGGDRVTGCGSLYRWLGLVEGQEIRMNSVGIWSKNASVVRSNTLRARTTAGKRKGKDGPVRKKNKRAGLGCARTVS